MDGNVMSADGWKAGVATVVITPREPMWLAGWAARREPAADTAMDLHAKALAVEDARGARAVIVTADLIAIPRSLGDAVAARVPSRCGLAREHILFNASHTHTGPEVRPDKVPFFEIPEEFAAKIPAYVARLEAALAGVIERAVAALAPATLIAREASVAFASNRRSAGGPTDHDVPILEVRGAGEKPIAILFGYACHNLTLPPSYCRYHGDYAGVAQAALEKAFPSAAALFIAGAGADQDPAPRGNPELGEQHGHALAEAVAAELTKSGRSVAPRLEVAWEDVMLDLQPLPSAETLQADLRSEDAPRRRKAVYLLAALAEKRPLATTQRCPVQIMRFGRELLLIALGGEPVVEFALHFKREFAGPLVWVAGYANDMFGYVPTRRVQQEGGYEGGRAALWSAVPMPVAENTQERIVAAVRRLGR